MAQTGNWSKLQDAREQLLKVTALQQWQRSQYAADQSRAAVLKALQQWTRRTAQTVRLPQNLPALPAAILSEQAFQDRLERMAATLPASEQTMMRANAELAYNGQPVDLGSKIRGTTAKLELN